MRSTRIVLAAFALSLASAFAQTTAGSIAGTVLDASQSAVSNAKVTATEQSKKTVASTVTDAEGRFVFPQMQPGTYTLLVEAPGFKKLDKTDINLYGNEKFAVGDMVLEVGAVEQSVEVSAQAVALQTESGERSSTLNTKQLENVALNSRSYLPLVGLTPGVATIPNLQTAGHGGVGSIAVNGARQNQNNLEFLGRLLGLAALLPLRRDAIDLVVREFALAHDFIFGKPMPLKSPHDSPGNIRL